MHQKFSLVFISLILLAFLNCDSTSDDTSGDSADSLYKGNWAVTFTGDYTGFVTVQIDKDGKFSNDNFPLADSSGTIYYDSIKGSVNSEGVFTETIIIYNAMAVQCATFAGSLDQNSDKGSGTFKNTINGLTGTWKATKYEGELNKFCGAWFLSFTGGYTGKSMIVINPDLTITGDKILVKDAKNITYSNKVIGKIDVNGNVTDAKITNNSMNMQVGIFTGTIADENSANGTLQITYNGTSANWTAVKK